MERASIVLNCGSVQIAAVTNGWIVTPVGDFQNNYQVQQEYGIHVFQTFPALVAFLEKHFRAEHERLLEPQDIRHDGLECGDVHAR
jgi:hypothetical protein